MSSAKWSGIEQKKYGLTARWYVSAKYGYATDEDGWGLYDPVSNVDGWGGKKRPFDTIQTYFNNFTGSRICVVDSGKYNIFDTALSGAHSFIGDGDVVLDQGNNGYPNTSNLYNLKCLRFKHTGGVAGFQARDCRFVFCEAVQSTAANFKNCEFVESLVRSTNTGGFPENCVFVRCVGGFTNHSMYNCLFVDCPDFSFNFSESRSVGTIVDYSIIIGTVKSNIVVNGKAPSSALTLEDFKAGGQYFRKSYSEVDLFGNAEGSGANIPQLNEIFNNFYHPYIDDWQYLDLSLRPDVDDRVRYGGLNGHFIGAFPVGYHFDIPTLWNTYKDAGNTTNVELNMSNKLIRTNPAIPGVYTSTTITLPNAIDETDVAMFFKNNVYDSNGVAVQRLDYSVDPAKDAALEQRTVYSYRMKTSPDDVTPLTDWKEYELDRAPTVDASGNSNIDDLFDSETETKQPIKRFIIEITLRSE